MNAPKNCVACNRHLIVTVSSVTLRHHIGNTWTMTFACPNCRALNERTVDGGRLDFLIRHGVPVDELDPVLAIFEARLEDDNEIEAFVNEWAKTT